MDLPKEALRRLKVSADRRGITVEQLLRIAAENELQQADAPASERRVKFPVLDSSEPGAVNLSNADIEALLG